MHKTPAESDQFLLIGRAMKIKLLQNKSGRNLIKINLSKKDSFDYATASQLVAGTQSFLLPFTFTGNNRNPVLYYDLTGCISLKTLLGGTISRRQFESIVGQIVAVLDKIGTSSLVEKNLLLTLGAVYLDAEDSRVRLLYLPLAGRASDDRAVLDLLEKIAVASRFAMEEDKQYAQSLLDFLRKQSVFSVIALQTFFGLPAALPHAAQAGSTETVQRSNNQNKTQPVSFGRDFVSERSGMLSRAQVTEQRSTAESILAAVSENLEGSSELQRTPSCSREQQNVVTQLPESQSVELEQVEPQPCLQTDETGTTFLGSQSALLDSAGYDESDAKELPRYWLVRESDKMRWELAQGNTTIGRSKTCDIQVSESPSVSRQHAVLALTSAGLLLTDEGSKNGTTINEKRIEAEHPAPLQKGSTVTLGDVRFFIER